jgi:hypothetical protein
VTSLLAWLRFVVSFCSFSIAGYFTNHGMKKLGICTLLDSGASDMVVSAASGNKVNSLAPYHLKSTHTQQQICSMFRSADAPMSDATTGAVIDLANTAVSTASTSTVSHGSTLPRGVSQGQHRRGSIHTIAGPISQALNPLPVATPHARIQVLDNNPFSDDEFDQAYSDFNVDDPALVEAVSGVFVHFIITFFIHVT